ncbi:MAG: cyclic nucleotide-binding domain-containing protein [Chitinispirillaceae bacterium]|nr:cyclic nucleotide-binding domain-containing protein [Chitinispirillaceae bacterium]
MDNPVWSFFFRPPQEKMVNIELMKELPVFESLTTGELVQIERVLHERHYGPGEVVFNEGEPGAGLYIIKKGEISIRKKIAGSNDIQLAVIPERSFFGELALLDEIPRSASAIAVTPTILYGFSKPDLEHLLERNQRLGIKIILNLSKLVSRRLVKSNENLEEVQAELNRFKQKEAD